MRAHWNTPIYHRGYLYGFSGRHLGEAELRCVEWKTGRVMWRKPGLTRASLLYVDRHFVCLGEDGLLRLVQASERAYVEVAMAEVREKPGDPPLNPTPGLARPHPFPRFALRSRRGPAGLYAVDSRPAINAGRAAQNRWNPHRWSAEPAGRFCSAEVWQVIRAEGPAVHPAKGEALVYRSHHVLYSAVFCSPVSPRESMQIERFSPVVANPCFAPVQSGVPARYQAQTRGGRSAGDFGGRRCAGDQGGDELRCNRLQENRQRRHEPARRVGGNGLLGWLFLRRLTRWWRFTTDRR